jgi:hypothetical protein
MERKSKKDIKAALDKMREDHAAQTPTDSQYVQKPLESKKSNKRIRKQGI